ncbi:hypothetical protein U729_3128 (plasmid) [Clostridium baratii str. Sullivan]|uniref:Uncharacterized protein n=1 Tax=Clostridium baratii str. Sullivan TaxID=1415775 RepID=A0A0A7G0G4_9CLOT|nr:hypothetical protein [Clostridium baratii]AIY85328.1 hypothetical protein U729_3128 [Clostridium baratii str. Sullivan]
MYQNITSTNNLYSKKESCENCKNKIICKYVKEKSEIDKSISDLREKITTHIFSINIRCSSYVEEQNTFNLNNNFNIGTR